jgi:hypothetical protein
MFKLKNILVFFMVILFGFGVGFAVETNYNQTVSPSFQPGKIIYQGTVTFTDSGNGDIYYTQAMLVAPVTYSDALARFACSEVGTEDVNVFIEYSFDNVTYFAGTTPANLDAVGVTAVIDTIGTEAGVGQIKHRVAVWMRFKFVVGQAMNATTLTWAASFILPAGAIEEDLYKVKNTPTS